MSMLQHCNNVATNRNKNCDKIASNMTSVGNHRKLQNWLLAEMDKRGWSQSDLARSANLNRAVINKLLNGPSVPRPSTLEAIARAFRVPVEGVYRLAGLLPEVPESESFVEEITHHVRKIQSPQRKTTALNIIKALVSEDEDEQKSNK